MPLATPLFFSLATGDQTQSTKTPPRSNLLSQCKRWERECSFYDNCREALMDFRNEVVGRHALFFDDDAMATFVNSADALVEWNSLKVDRYEKKKERVQEGSAVGFENSGFCPSFSVPENLLQCLNSDAWTRGPRRLRYTCRKWCKRWRRNFGLQVRCPTGTVEYKLFVGSLNKQASVKEVEEIFSPYGRVEDVYLMRDEMKQSRGCGFVKYSNREMALAAINALSGKFTMRGCDQPLTVRFADPKRPRAGESRGPSFGGPGSGPHFQAPGIRPPPTLSEPVHDQIAPNAWRPMAAPNPGPISNASIHGFGNQFPLRSNDVQVSSALGGSSDNSFPVSSTSQQGGHGGSGDGSYLGLSVSSSMSQQSLNQPLVQNHSVGPQISPLQKPVPSPQHLPSSLQLQQPVSTPFSQTQNSPALLRQLHQVQMPQSTGQSPVSQAMSSQQPGLHGEFAMTQPQVQQTVPSGLANQQLPAQQSLQHLHQSPSQLAQMLSQQTQTLQASFQSSQQAFSQLQQQLQMMQPSNQNLTTQQGSQAAKQSSWPGTMQPAPAITSFQSPPTSAAPAAPATSQTIATLKCDWTEHTAPDGYKYYHNSVTGESKWEKPDELTLYEQQQQQQKQTHQTKPSIQQPQMQSYPQVISPQQAPQMQGQYQNPLQIQFRPPQQLQQTSQHSSYQVPGATGQRSNQEHSYAQLPHVAGSVNDPSRFQQGLQAGQEWMWKNKPAGT